MAYALTPESKCSPSSDISWTHLLSELPKGEAQTIAIVDVNKKDDVPEDEILNLANNIGENQLDRRESLMGTFNRHLRMSFKAVSESPGPLTR